MRTEIDIEKLKALYSNDVNIIEYLSANTELCREKIIQISYDLQSGSYIQLAKSDQYAQMVAEYAAALAQLIQRYEFCSLMEVGVGEATNLASVLQYLGPDKHYLGFDISVSRLLFAQQYLRDLQVEQSGQLFCADLFNIPLADNSVDVVYTSHSLEPNGGREREALSELYRVARKAVILLEPAYELASPAAQERMQRHGYVKNLAGTARDLQMSVVEHRLFKYSFNASNPTGVLIIEKDPEACSEVQPEYQCPYGHGPMTVAQHGQQYAPSSGLLYPAVCEIPVLMAAKGVLTAHYDKFM